ncbi:HAD family hydrolase [Sediminibacillus massiliensis]|uniref:HAD family hydrolase n=1 Tax=Sediminibacillus massiliensis TaxID=1926277 RepID=UPI0009888236|nr:HAD family hydrolase [Sediminibacillus massiliensis]
MDTIIFDVDDTLYDQALSLKKTIKRMISQPLTDEEMDQFYIISRQYSDSLFDKSEDGEVSKQEMHIRRVTGACEAFGIPMTREQAIEFQEAYVEEQQRITLFEEVEELLESLHNQNKQLAILTNGEENHQSMKIKQLDLARWIPEENIFISGALGIAKPKREVFQILEDKLQLDKEKTVYVGDSFDNDIVGAKQAGWNAYWMNHRKRDMPDTPFKPDKTFYDAKELLDTLIQDISYSK